MRVELGLTGRPPGSVDPEFESLIYTVVIDVDDDDQPDYRLKYGNDGDETGTMRVSLEDRTNGVILVGARLPGRP